MTLLDEQERAAIKRVMCIADIEARLRRLVAEGRERTLEVKEAARALSAEKETLRREYDAMAKLYKEKSEGFPWLAEAYEEYCLLRDRQVADSLERKERAAPKAAERLRQMSYARRRAERELRVAKHLLEMYEWLFPFLVDFRGEDVDDYIRVTAERAAGGDKPEDQVFVLTTEGERANLTRPEIFQHALDRYWQKRKSPWEVGRDYERYVGYQHERDGYAVYYQGIIQGLEDLGRDLIAKKGREVLVIQCKHWSQHKRIHEKHICQLFGTTLKYWVENQRSLRKELNIQLELFAERIGRSPIRGLFFTSTWLSDTAREFAKELGITVKEGFPLQPYPSIKCNVSRRTGEKIYHLPFDQQYDRTLIEEERNECYVETVAEAERMGYRRAFRWKGNTGSVQPPCPAGGISA